MSIGLHGALLPFVLALAAFTVGKTLGLIAVSPRGLVYFGALYVDYGLLFVGFCVVVGIYYLVWKYLVNFLNGVVGIA